MYPLERLASGAPLQNVPKTHTRRPPAHPRHTRTPAPRDRTRAPTARDRTRGTTRHAHCARPHPRTTRAVSPGAF